MAAPTHKPLLLLLLASACASTDMTHEPRPQTADAAKSSPAAGVMPAVDDDLADLEASLEAYEQQLASNEARLRAMGVMVATRDGAAPSAEAPGRFAPPPPAAPATTSKPTTPSRSYADEDQASAQSRRPQKEAEKDKKRAAKSPSAGAGTTSASPPAPSPAPRRDAGVRPGDAPEAKQDADKEDSRGRCAELCDLADSTCELEGKICDLAARHQGDARYAEVCRRADEDCRIAAEACTLCSP